MGTKLMAYFVNVEFADGSESMEPVKGSRRVAMRAGYARCGETGCDTYVLYEDTVIAAFEAIPESIDSRGIAQVAQVRQVS